MRVYDSPAGAAPERGCVAAAGTFDGVHRGHQEVLRRAVALARELEVSPLLLTFTDPPARSLAAGAGPLPLTTLSDRLLLAERLGIAAALTLPFTPELAAEPAEGFVRRVLAGALAVRGVVVGEGWRFGRGREGDTALLARLGGEFSYRLCEVPPVREEGTPVSSTRIREAIAAGRVEEAAVLLGRPHFLRGVVEPGEGRGRRLGFPTVNLRGEGALPPPGVYAGACSPADGRWLLPAGIFVGRRLTFGGGPVTVEAHLPGVDLDLYGEELALGFLSFLREEKTFSDGGSLSEQIGLDLPRVVEAFAHSGLAGLP